MQLSSGKRAKQTIRKSMPKSTRAWAGCLQVEGAVACPGSTMGGRVLLKDYEIILLKWEKGTLLVLI